jgi:hypothetical protein
MDALINRGGHRGQSPMIMLKDVPGGMLVAVSRASGGGTIVSLCLLA